MAVGCPARPAEVRMNRPCPSVVSFDNHSRWYVPFLRLAFEESIDTKREWVEGIYELQQHWNIQEATFQDCLVQIRGAYHSTGQYEVLRNYVASVPFDKNFKNFYWEITECGMIFTFNR